MSRDTLVIDAERIVAGLSEEDRDLFRRAELGVELEAWLETNPVGQFLAAVCDLERADAIEALVKSMNDDDEKEAKAAHRRVALCDLFRSWLGDALEAGREAEAILKARENSDLTP
jgi:hypothetical protein